jgi:hypothetical protein
MLVSNYWSDLSVLLFNVGTKELARRRLHHAQTTSAGELVSPSHYDSHSPETRVPKDSGSLHTCATCG